jgi:hypothetical protein
VLASSALVFISWDHKQDRNDFQRTYEDTPKVNKNKNNNVREKKVRDLDEALEELEEVDLKNLSVDIQKEIAEAMKQVDAAKIQTEIQKAMKSVDMEKIMQEVKESMKSVDMEAIQKEIKEAMKEVDAAKIQMEVEKAMKEVDFEKIQKEVRESLSKVDMAKIKAEVEQAQKIDMKELEVEMKKVQEEMKEIGPKIEKEMAKAKVEIEKAKAELKEYKSFVDGLEKDGLINKKENYTIEHKKGELMINGKKASEQTYNKYRSFLEKHASFSIEKDEDDFDIDMD